MSTYYISRNPEYYGSDATDEDAIRCADIIAEKAAAEYPDVTFEIGEGQSDMDEDEAGEIQQYINDNWTDWV